MSSETYSGFDNSSDGLFGRRFVAMLLIAAMMLLTGTENSFAGAPIASDGVLTTKAGVPRNGKLTASGGTGVLTYKLVTAPANGFVGGLDPGDNNTTGNYIYVPGDNMSGTETFSYTVTDSASTPLTSAPATITLTVLASSAPPTANNGSLLVVKGFAKTGQLSATQGRGGTLVFSIVGNPGNGTVSLTNTATGTFTYVQTNLSAISDSFSFKVAETANNVTMNSGIAVISVTINATNIPPTANNGSLIIRQDTSPPGPNGYLTASDPENDELVYTILTPPTKGVVSPLPTTGTKTGSVPYTYTPYSGQYGSDSFTFKATQTVLNQTSSGTGTINITIVPTGADTPPTAFYSYQYATSMSMDLSGKLNASDSEADMLHFAIVNSAGNPTTTSTNGGLVTITNPNPSGGSADFVYSPKMGFTGQDSFWFRVNELYGAGLTSNNAEVVITVNSVPNNSPIAQNIPTQYTEAGKSVSGTLTATDADGDMLYFSVVSPPINGTAIITNALTGAFVYTPDAGFAGKDFFTFKANDGIADSAISKVNIVATIPILCDFNSDGRVGLEEVIYILQIIAGIR